MGSTTETLKHPPEYAKALYGALVAGLGALGTALADEQITTGEWVGIASVAVAAFGVVFGVRNR